MLPVLLSSNSKSCFYDVLLTIPYLQQGMPCHRWGWYQLRKPQMYELSLPSHAQAGQWGRASLQKPFLSSQLYPLNTALYHVLSNYWSHFWPVLLSFRSNSFQTKQCRPVWEQALKRFIEIITEMVLFGSLSPFWSFSEKENTEDCFKTGFEELLLTGENYGKQNHIDF